MYDWFLMFFIIEVNAQEDIRDIRKMHKWRSEIGVECGNVTQPGVK